MVSQLEQPSEIRFSDLCKAAENPVVAWALAKLAEACEGRGIAFRPPEGPAFDPKICLIQLTEMVNPSGALPGSYRLVQNGNEITISARDGNGFSYALTEMASALTARQFDLWQSVKIEAAPSSPVRGICRAFSSFDEDMGWFHDRAFWTQYLDHLACSRFNRFHLAFGMQFNFGTIDPGLTDNYLAFTDPFLVDADPSIRVEGLTSGERDQNLAALQFIAAETKRRGMTFTLGLWTQAYAFPAPTRHRFPIIGVSETNHAQYCAGALAKLLAAVPEIDVLTFRVHFEAGIREATQHIFWDHIFEAIAAAGRPIEVDLHAKGVGPELLAAADRRGLKVVLSAKYWAEHLGLPYHQTTIRAQETARPVPPGETMSSLASYSRLFTRYGYADYLAETKTTDMIFRMWPGTQKLLLWGDPAFAAGYGRNATFGGAKGVEFCEPLFFKGRKGGAPGARDPYVRDDLRLYGREWEKYRYTYLLWGRLLYDPDCSPEVWRRLLTSDYGDAAIAVESGLGALSRILPLVSVVHGVGGANNLYWPEIYVDLPISAWLHQAHYDKTYEWDNSAPQNWGRVSAFDPAMFYAINEYVADVAAGEVAPRYTPLEVAAWLEDFVAQGEVGILALEMCQGGDAAQAERCRIDMMILSCLGQFFAGKFRAAVAYGVFEVTRDRAAIEATVQLLEAAREAFGAIVEIVKGVYQPDLVFGTELSEHGHWSMRLKAMDDDLRVLRLERDRSTSDSDGSYHRLLAKMGSHRVQRQDIEHAPQPFVRGMPHKVHLQAPTTEMVLLHARAVDQSRRFQSIAMTKDQSTFSATIPAEITGAGFPVMYYFEVGSGEKATLYPGLAADLSNQPYYSIFSTDRGAGATKSQPVGAG